MKHGLISLRILFLSALGFIAGCASTGSRDLLVTSHGSGRAYTQHFAEGYMSCDGTGSSDVVLACDADHPAGHPGVLKQVMHIRVMWHSDRVTKWEGAADTNASIRWYVFTEHAGAPELIEYAGTGLVAISGEGEHVTVTVNNAQLHPVFNHGQLTDPIGPSSFEGTVVARSDRQRVDQLLAEVRTTVAATSLPPMPIEAKTAEARVAP